MKAEAVQFPAVTLCNFRTLHFDVINQINERFASGSRPRSDPRSDPGSLPQEEDNNGTLDYDIETRQDQDIADDHVDYGYLPTDNFMLHYLKFVSQLTNIIVSDRYRQDPQVRLAIQVSTIDPILWRRKCSLH